MLSVKLLNHCYCSLMQKSLCFLCIAFGPKIPRELPQIMIGNAAIEWTSSINYLGVQFVSGK